jgi:hypothetical protein
VHVVGFAAELNQFDIEFGAYRAHSVLADVRMASVVTDRWYLVTKTKCGCRNDPLCWERR